MGVSITMIVLYERGTKHFTGNGDYVLNSIIYDDSVEWDLTSGQWELSFSAPVVNPLNINFEVEQVVRTPTPNFKEDQLFYVIHTERDLTEWNITAIHISNKIKNIYMHNTLIRDKSVVDAANQIINYRGMDLNFKINVDSKNKDRLVDTHFERMNALQAITDDTLDNSIVTQSETEFTANNFNLILTDKIGKNRGADIRYQRELLDFAETVDASGIVGRVVPVGNNGFTIPTDMGGPYIEYKHYDPLIHKTEEVEYSNVIAAFGEDIDHENALPVSEAVRQLKRLGEREFTLANVQEPVISYEIDIYYLPTSFSSKLQKIKPGDSILIFDNKGNEIKERLIGYSYQPTTKKYTNITLANKTPEITALDRKKKIHGGGTLTT